MVEAKMAKLRNSDSCRKLQNALWIVGQQCLRIVGACLFKKLSRSPSTSSPHPSHCGFLSSPHSSRRSRTSPLQETHLQQSPIMSRDLSYGCCHAAAHITKHCRTLATEHYRASPIMSGDVGYGCRGDEAVGDWNFK